MHPQKPRKGGDVRPKGRKSLKQGPGQIAKPHFLHLLNGLTNSHSEDYTKVDRFGSDGLKILKELSFRFLVLKSLRPI